MSVVREDTDLRPSTNPTQAKEAEMTQFSERAKRTRSRLEAYRRAWFRAVNPYTTVQCEWLPSRVLEERSFLL
ncbi:hypothetical protein CYMTET_54910 [Cymbomonas tetramitiformis]|uniref:Uncharacterized protein n=1 Tax=Cymbomonas tetramitiformis TaxID=36881 RepID=A0AAE0BEA0_9CHLO|nr:hypothetical protein CYMTET_54910 [Cymbomonas tetramitiformis]